MFHSGILLYSIIFMLPYFTYHATCCIMVVVVLSGERCGFRCVCYSIPSSGVGYYDGIPGTKQKLTYTFMNSLSHEWCLFNGSAVDGIT